MKKYIITLFFLLSLNAIAGWVEDMEMKYNIAVGAVITLEDTVKRNNLSDYAEKLNDEVERLDEERYKIVEESDELRGKSDKAISSFSNLDLKLIDTTELKKLVAEYSLSADDCNIKISKVLSLAREILSLNTLINTSGDYADWDWIIDNFGAGSYTDSNKTEYDNIQHECDETCDCANKIYNFNYWGSNYRLLVQYIDAKTIKSLTDHLRKDIP